jgi:hypothetical protein
MTPTPAAPTRRQNAKYAQWYQREKADVALVEAVVVGEVEAEQLRYLDADRGGRRAAHHDQQVAAGARRSGSVRTPGQHQLFP